MDHDSSIEDYIFQQKEFEWEYMQIDGAARQHVQMNTTGDFGESNLILITPYCFRTPQYVNDIAPEKPGISVYQPIIKEKENRYHANLQELIKNIDRTKIKVIALDLTSQYDYGNAENASNGLIDRVIFDYTPKNLSFLKDSKVNYIAGCYGDTNMLKIKKALKEAAPNAKTVFVKDAILNKRMNGWNSLEGMDDMIDIFSKLGKRAYISVAGVSYKSLIG